MSQGCSPKGLRSESREEEASVPRVTQQNYPRFERDFAPPVTGFVAFAQAVHNDLLAVKRNIEQGEFSLRRFFNLVVMKHIKTDNDGLALEEDFQALLGGELNHASNGRYGVTQEPTLPAATRRDVLCQLGEARATIELKMSERWTVDDYLVALDDQLRGQYMQAANSKIGFFVVVLQRVRQWDAPTGGRVDFARLITLLEKERWSYRPPTRPFFSVSSELTRPHEKTSALPELLRRLRVKGLPSMQTRPGIRGQERGGVLSGSKTLLLQGSNSQSSAPSTMGRSHRRHSAAGT